MNGKLVVHVQVTRMTGHGIRSSGGRSDPTLRSIQQQQTILKGDSLVKRFLSVFVASMFLASAALRPRPVRTRRRLNQPRPMPRRKPAIPRRCQGEIQRCQGEIHRRQSRRQERREESQQVSFFLDCLKSKVALPTLLFFCPSSPARAKCDQPPGTAVIRGVVTATQWGYS